MRRVPVPSLKLPSTRLTWLADKNLNNDVLGPLLKILSPQTGLQVESQRFLPESENHQSCHHGSIAATHSSSSHQPASDADRKQEL